jgi:hypothetical protein
MNRRNIKKLVNSIELIPIKEDNFEDLCKKTFDFFASDKIRFEHYLSPRYDSDFARKLSFPRNPKWNYLIEKTFDRIEMKPDFLQVHFKENWSIIGGIFDKYRPLSLGFDSDKAMYIASQDENGFPKYPSENLLLRID